MQLPLGCNRSQEKILDHWKNNLLQADIHQIYMLLVYNQRLEGIASQICQFCFLPQIAQLLSACLCSQAVE